MKKIYTLFLICFWLSINHSYSQMVIDGLTYNVDTLENHLVGPGSRYTAIRLTGPHKQNVFFLKTDLKNPYIQFRQVLGRDSLYGTESPSSIAHRKSTEGTVYFAGTNGDFFDTSSAYPAGFNGRPVGGNMMNSELAQIFNTCNVFAVDENGIPGSGNMAYSGNVKYGTATASITSVNYTRETNALVLFNQNQGKFTKTNQYGTEALIELLPGNTWGVNKTLQAKVTAIETNIGNMAIPAGKAVLSGNGTAATWLNQLAVGDEVEISFSMTMDGESLPWSQITGGDTRALMLKNGVVETNDVWTSLDPRTAIGYTVSRDTVIFCVVDGRSGVSEGVTTKQLAQLMQSAGAWTAINLDGGGSSCLYIDSYGGPVNVPSDGSERPCGNSVFVVSSAPSDPVIAQIIPYQDYITLPRYGEYIPQFYGYNQYGTFLDKDVQNVTLSCDPSLGTVQGNKFVATGAQSGTITATYNGTVTAAIYVNLLPVDAMKIRLDTVIVDSRSDYSIEVQASSNGNMVPIASSALTWTVDDPAICEVIEGSVKALQNGMTRVHGGLGDLKDSLVVSVQNPETNRLPMTPFQFSDWTISASSQLNAVLNTNNLPIEWSNGVAANFTFAAGRAPFIRLYDNQLQTYGLPDTLKIVLNMGGVPVSNAYVYLQPNHSNTTVVQNFGAFQSTDIELSIPLDGIIDVTDRANYPLKFDNIYFMLETSMNAGQNYTIALKDIVQIYNGVPYTGIQNPQTVRFSVYPNPSTGREINIRLEDGQEQTLHVEIYTLSGQRAQAETLKSQGGVANFIRKDLQPGIYLLRITGNNQIETVKLIVK